jgi:hypothetical protein
MQVYVHELVRYDIQKAILYWRGFRASKYYIISRWHEIVIYSKVLKILAPFIACSILRVLVVHSEEKKFMINYEYLDIYIMNETQF